MKNPAQGMTIYILFSLLLHFGQTQGAAASSPPIGFPADLQTGTSILESGSKSLPGLTDSPQQFTMSLASPFTSSNYSCCLSLQQVSISYETISREYSIMIEVIQQLQGSLELNASSLLPSNLQTLTVRYLVVAESYSYLSFAYFDL
jgi:hypothetical protein